MQILIILLFIFFAVSVGLLWVGLAAWSIFTRRQYPDKELPPLKKRAFLSTAVPGAILGLVILPAELLCLQGVLGFQLKGGSVIFLLLFLVSFLAVVHAYVWGIVNAREVSGTRPRWKKMALASAVVLGSPLVITMLAFSLAHFVRFSVHFALIAAFVLLPGFLLLTHRGRSLGFPDPSSYSKFRVFFFPFLLGACTGFLCGFLEILLLLAVSGSRGMETGTAASLFLIMIGIASAIGVVNGTWWGILNLRRTSERELRWMPFVSALGLSLLLPLAVTVIGAGIALFFFSVKELTVLWLIGLGFGALIGLAYWLLKMSQASARKGAAEPPRSSPLKRYEPHPVPAQVLPTQKTIDEKQVFWKTFAYVAVLVLVVSTGFSFGARMAILHWAENPGGGGWINFSGMVEVMILWGLQILASVLCFLGGFGVASALSLTGGVKIRYSLSYGVVLGLIAVGANFVVDALTVMGLMIAHGLP